MNRGIDNALLEIGMGMQILGVDSIKATVNALQNNSITVAKALGQLTDSFRVEVNIGVSHPDWVNKIGIPRNSVPCSRSKS